MALEEVELEALTGGDRWDEEDAGAVLEAGRRLSQEQQQPLVVQAGHRLQVGLAGLPPGDVTEDLGLGGGHLLGGNVMDGH